MANARMAIGSLFGAVAGLGNTVSSTLNATTKGVGMLEALVDEAAADQKKRIALNAVHSKKIMVQEKAKEINDRQEEIEKYLGTDVQRRTRYAANYDELMAALDELDNVKE